MDPIETTPEKIYDTRESRDLTPKSKTDSELESYQGKASKSNFKVERSQTGSHSKSPKKTISMENKRSSTLDNRNSSPKKVVTTSPKKSPLKEPLREPLNSNLNPLIKRGSTFAKAGADLNKRMNILQANPDIKNSKRIIYSFKKTNEPDITKIQSRKYKREPLDVYLEYLNNRDINKITSEHIYLFDLHKIAEHFDDFEIMNKIHEYIDDNISEETIPLFLLEIVNLNKDFTNTFEEIFLDMDSEWKGALTNIINYFDSRNVKEISEAIKNELELYLMENENISIQKIDFFMFLLEKIPYVNEKTRILLMSVFLRHFAKLNSNFNSLVDKTLGREFLKNNKDIASEIYGYPNYNKNYTENESVIYRNLMTKAENNYKQKVNQLEDYMKEKLMEMGRKMDEYKAYNEELVQQNQASERDIVSLKHNVKNLTIYQDKVKSINKENDLRSNAQVVHEIKLEFDAMHDELKANSEKIAILEKEKGLLIEQNEKLLNKHKKSKLISKGLKTIVEGLEVTIQKNNEVTKSTFESNYKEITNFIKLLSNADDNFGNLSKELDSIKVYLQKEYSEHENTKKSNNILRLLNSQMEERIKNNMMPNSNQGTTTQGFQVTKQGKQGAKMTIPNKTQSQVNQVIQQPGRLTVQPKSKSKTLSFSVKKTFPATSQQINCIANISYGTTEIIAAGGTDNLIKLYNLEYWDIIASLSGHRDFISALLFLNEFQPLLISGSADRTIKIWKLSNNSCIQNIIAHAGAIYCLLYIGKNLFVSGSGDKSMKIWNIDNGACVKKVQTHTNYVTSLTNLCPVGKKNLIASGSWDSTIKIWDYEDEDDTISSLLGHEGNVNCLLYIDAWDKEMMASGSSDKNVKLWNVVTGECVKTSKGHEGPVTSLMSLTNVESSIVISGSEDKSLRVWYLTSGDCISVIKTDHSFGIKVLMKVEFKRKDINEKEEKECFITVGNDKVVKLWQLGE